MRMGHPELSALEHLINAFKKDKELQVFYAFAIFTNGLFPTLVE
jgi:hypothetical protein